MCRHLLREAVADADQVADSPQGARLRVKHVPKGSALPLDRFTGEYAAVSLLCRNHRELRDQRHQRRHEPLTALFHPALRSVGNDDHAAKLGRLEKKGADNHGKHFAHLRKLLPQRKGVKACAEAIGSEVVGSEARIIPVDEDGCLFMRDRGIRGRKRCTGEADFGNHRG